MPPRSKKNIEVAGKRYWIKELTVSDVFELESNFEINENRVGDIILYLFEDQLISKSITNCPLHVLVDLQVSEFKEVCKVFFDLNHLLFRKKDRASVDKKRGSSVDNLFALFCNLIEAGHVNALSYGFSFFIKAVNNHELIKNTSIVSIADAIRVARGSDDKQWKRYVQSLVGRHG